MIINKKGSIELAIYGVVAFALIILTLIFYWYFIVMPYAIATTPIEQNIVAKEKIDADIMLLNYLRTPIEIEGQTITISDLIRLYFIDNQRYESQLKDETKKIFENGLNYTYKLEINQKELLEYKKDTASDKIIDKIDASSIIPLQGQGLIEINLEVILER